MPIACVDVAIIINGKVLLVKRNNEPAKDEYWLPGGRIYKNETMIDCAKRKAIEEVGIECNVGNLIHTGETIFNTGPFDIPVHTVNFCFIMFPTYDRIEFKLDEYHSDYKLIDKITPDLNQCDYFQKCLNLIGLRN
jgi:colanic acid biosynthesis protein WcaH